MVCASCAGTGLCHACDGCPWKPGGRPAKRRAVDIARGAVPKQNSLALSLQTCTSESELYVLLAQVDEMQTAHKAAQPEPKALEAVRSELQRVCEAQNADNEKLRARVNELKTSQSVSDAVNTDLQMKLQEALQIQNSVNERHEAQVNKLKASQSALEAANADLQANLTTREEGWAVQQRALEAQNQVQRDRIHELEGDLQKVLQEQHDLVTQVARESPQPSTFAQSVLRKIGLRNNAAQVPVMVRGVSAVKWQWQTADGTFVDFEAGASDMIERDWKTGARLGACALRVVNEGVKVDVHVQRQESSVAGSQHRRPIRRVDMTEAAPEPTWTPQGEEVALVPVRPGSTDYEKVVRSMFSSDGAFAQRFAPTEVVRIQNKFLLRAYNAEWVNTVKVRGPRYLNEMVLFHGTRATCPRGIAESRPGLMVEYSREHGFYGKGIYFAESPCYSHHYSHHRRRNEEFQMLVCRVIVGKSRHFGNALSRDMSRRELPASDYDSVTGGPHTPTQQGPGPDASALRVVYQPAQVYPEFIVTYCPVSVGAAVTIAHAGG